MSTGRSNTDKSQSEGTTDLRPAAFSSSSPLSAQAGVPREQSQRERDILSPAVLSTPTPKWAQKKIRLHPDTAQRVDYWRRQRELASDNEYIALAVEEKIARENGDYDLPTLEIQRLNQLIDEIKALSTNQSNLERVVTSGLGSLLGLTRGDSYLLDDESGELATDDSDAGQL